MAMAHSVEDRNLKLRKRRENVFIAKPEASNTFLVIGKQDQFTLIALFETSSPLRQFYMRHTEKNRLLHKRKETYHYILPSTM